MVFQGTKFFLSQTGVQQGDMRDLIEELAETNEEFRQVSHLDDGLLAGPAPLVLTLLQRLTTLLAAKDLSVNFTKCEACRSPPASFNHSTFPTSQTWIIGLILEPPPRADLRCNGVNVEAH